MTLSAFVLWGDDYDPGRYDGKPIPAPLQKVLVGEHRYVTWAYHAGILIRDDVLDYDGPSRWHEWVRASESTPSWVTDEPVLVACDCLFPRPDVKHLTDRGCLILPLAGHPDRRVQLPHAVVRGEDHIGWIMPSSPEHSPTPSAFHAPPPPLPTWRAAR